jgi:HAE1 family hydrophobic/amphiphilic exporter-1
MSKNLKILLCAPTSNGSFKLGDVARVELGAVNYAGKHATNGNQSVAIAIAQTAGSNARSY